MSWPAAGPQPKAPPSPVTRPAAERSWVRHITQADWQRKQNLYKRRHLVFPLHKTVQQALMETAKNKQLHSPNCPFLASKVSI